MHHFDDAQFVDYVRGVLSPADAASLQQHIAACSDCAGALQLWQAFQRSAEADAQLQPDPVRERMVKAMFALHHPKQRLSAQVLVDSLATAASGVRTAGLAPRQIAFQSGNYTVDIHLAKKESPNLYTLVGQILDRRDPYGVSYMPVAFAVGGREPLRACTNRFGEFEFDVEMDREAVLTVALTEGSILELPISLEQAINTDSSK